MNRARILRSAAVVVAVLCTRPTTVSFSLPVAHAGQAAARANADATADSTAAQSRRVAPAQAVADRYGAAIVVVAAGTRRAHGFFVSSDGILCTVLPGARPGDGVVLDRDETAGTVAVVDDDGLALVVVPTPAGSVRAALGVAAVDGLTDRWLVGLARDDRGVVRGALGDLIDEHAARLRLLLPLPRGAPVLNRKNEVVAVAVTGHSAGVVQAVPSSRVRSLAGRLRTSPTDAPTR
jgi:hypothetical protein